MAKKKEPEDRKGATISTRLDWDPDHAIRSIVQHERISVSVVVANIVTAWVVSAGADVVGAYRRTLDLLNARERERGASAARSADHAGAAARRSRGDTRSAG